MCRWVFVSVSCDEDNKRAIGILLNAIALFKLSMNEQKTQMMITELEKRPGDED